MTKIMSEKDLREIMDYGIGKYLNNVHIFKMTMNYISKYKLVS